MKKALMVWGGWPGHEPKQCVDVFAPFLEGQGYDVEVYDTLDAYLDEAKMRALDLIVPVWTQGTQNHVAPSVFGSHRERNLAGIARRDLASIVALACPVKGTRWVPGAGHRWDYAPL